MLARARRTFQGLLDGVVNRLRPVPDGFAARVLAAEAQLRAADLPIELPPGFSGIATPDRVFGLLEEEFGREAVERTVAAILRPVENPDLLAHRTVLRLACGPRDAPRLVTTNFARLFELADPNLPVHLPPKLDPGARGIVKLHGSADAMSEGPEGDGFVLSGAAFGGAYVADGWAARTMRALLERHTVVFGLRRGRPADAPAGMLGHREAAPFLGEWENPETARQGFVSRARRRTIQGGAFGRDGSSGGDA